MQTDFFNRVVTRTIISRYDFTFFYSCEKWRVSGGRLSQSIVVMGFVTRYRECLRYRDNGHISCSTLQHRMVWYLHTCKRHTICECRTFQHVSFSSVAFCSVPFCYYVAPLSGYNMLLTLEKLPLPLDGGALGRVSTIISALF